MQEEHGIAPPVVAHGKHVSRRVEQGEIAPGDLRHLLAHAHDPLHPIVERVRVPPLIGDIDVGEAIGPIGDDRRFRRRGGREPAVGFARPLHRRPRAGAFGQRKIVAHPDLIAVAEHRRARQGQHQANSEGFPHFQFPLSLSEAGRGRGGRGKPLPVPSATLHTRQRGVVAQGVFHVDAASVDHLAEERRDVVKDRVRARESPAASAATTGTARR